MSTPSIRQKLLIGISLLVSFILIFCTLLIDQNIKSSFYRRIDQDLIKVATLLAAEIEIEDDKITNEWVEDIIENPNRKHDLVQTWDLTTGKTTRSPALGKSDLPRIAGNLNEYVFENFQLPGNRPGRALGVKIYPALDEEEKGELKPENHPQILVVADEISTINNTLYQIRLVMGITLILALLFSAATIWLIIKTSLAPINTLTEWIRRRDESQIGARPQFPDNIPTELKPMVTQYNSLLARIDANRQRERDFSAHAAHELRTPLSGIQSTLEQLLNRPRSNEDYQSQSRDLLQITRNMSAIIASLMQLSHIKNQDYQVNAVKVRCDEVILTCWQELEPTWRQNDVCLNWEQKYKKLILVTDPDLLTICLKNLFDNAISYAPSGSEITLKTNQQDAHLTFDLSNPSPPVSETELNRLMEPFYRLDKARTNPTRHAGIGLSLCYEITRQLNGRLSIRHLNGHFHVCLTLPL